MAHLLKNLFRGRCLEYILRQSVFYRQYSSSKCRSLLNGVFLEDRGHIEVTGEDAAKFLNGLVTNDVNLFWCDTQMSALYCMMLNVKGRVMYDLFIYKLKGSHDTTSLLLECDSRAVDSILKTFKLYKLRSQVDFNDASHRFASWSVVEKEAYKNLELKNSECLDQLVFVEDPRLSVLGTRMVLPKTRLPSEYYMNVKNVMDKTVYDIHRVSHGVSESVKDIEPGVALPLEYNITELHGGMLVYPERVT